MVEWRCVFVSLKEPNERKSDDEKKLQLTSSSLLLLPLIIRNNSTVLFLLGSLLLFLLPLLFRFALSSVFFLVIAILLLLFGSGLLLGKLFTNSLRDGGGDDFTEFLKLGLCRVMGTGRDMRRFANLRRESNK